MNRLDSRCPSWISFSSNRKLSRTAGGTPRIRQRYGSSPASRCPSSQSVSLSFVSDIAISLGGAFRDLALDEIRDPLHGFTQPVDIAHDVTRRDVIGVLVVQQALQGIGGDIETLRDGDEGAAQVMQGKRHPGAFGDPRDCRAGFHQVAAFGLAREHKGTGGLGLAALQQRQQEIGKGQGVALVVLGLAQGEGLVLEIHIRPGQARGLGAAQAGEQEKVQVIAGGRLVQGEGGLIPGGELVRLDQCPAPFDLVPAPVIAQTVHRVGDE